MDSHSSKDEKHFETVFESPATPYNGEPSNQPTQADDAALATLGYRQEFKRAFTPIAVFGLAINVIGLVPSIGSVLVFAIPNGGPVALVWGWAITSFFIVFVALSLAELASAAPTSGGLYYWTWTFATPRWRKLLAWVVGYTNSMGLISGFASIDWGCAVQLMAAASIGRDEVFVPTTGQTFAVFVAILICHGILASLATHITARLQGFFIAVQILLVLAIIVALPASTPNEFRNPPAFAFGGFRNLNGWPNGFAFVLSYLAPLWTIAGFDAPIHISEEASNARTAVPWAIIVAVVIASTLGWVIIVVISLFMGTRMDAIMNNPIGQPMAAILFSSLGRNGTLVMWSIIVAVQFLMGSSALISASRQMFAFARDRAIPFSRHVAHVNARTHTPINAVWACVLIALVVGFIVFSGPVGSGAIFSLTIAGQYTSFAIPIMCRFLGNAEWKPGPFALGRFGLPSAIVAVAWMIFATVILAFPSTPRPGVHGMNYMVTVYSAWIALCLLYFYMPVYGGVHHFNGPQATIDTPAAAGEDDDPKESGVDRPTGMGSAPAALSPARA